MDSVFNAEHYVYNKWGFTTNKFIINGFECNNQFNSNQFNWKKLTFDY